MGRIEITPLEITAVLFGTGVFTGWLLMDGAIDPLLIVGATWISFAFAVLRLIARTGIVKPLHSAVPSMFFCLLLGTTAVLVNETADRDDLALLVQQLGPRETKSVSLSGVIVSFVVTDSTRDRFDISVYRLHHETAVQAVSGQLRVTIIHSEPEVDLIGRSKLMRGSRILLTGALSQARGRTNPADFDYAAYLKGLGVSGLVRVRSNKDIVAIDNSVGGYSHTIALARRSFQKQISAFVPVDAQAIPRALLTGDRSLMDDHLRTAFSESGLMHLLAISGLHVLFVGLAAYQIIRSLLLRSGFKWRSSEIISSVFSVFVLVMYSLITGATPSVVRASIMASAMLASRPLLRPTNTLNALAISFIVILSLSPLALLSIGFQLSFAAVFGLITAGRTASTWVAGWSRNATTIKIMGSICVSAVATTATAPFMIVHFGSVPLAGLFLNLGAIPVASGLLISTILVVGTGFVFPAAAAVFGSATHLLSSVLQIIAESGALTSQWSIVSPAAGLSSLCIPTLIILVLIPGLSKRFRRSLLFCIITVPAVEIIVLAESESYRSVVDVLFLDVNHGDAIIVRLPGGGFFLIDAGNRYRRYDVGLRTVIPNLRLLGAKSLEGVVTSHPHGDHFGGIPSVLKAFPTHCVFDNGQVVESSLYDRYETGISTHVGCRIAVKRGDVLNFDDQVRIYVLGPDENLHSLDPNEQSVVLKLVFRDTSFLFTGDVEREGEQLLVERYCDFLVADVVKVAHHGSRTSSTAAFVACTTAREMTRAVVSVGRPDKYGLPDEEVLIRWTDAGASLHTTLDNGSLWLRSDGTTIREIGW